MGILIHLVENYYYEEFMTKRNIVSLYGMFKTKKVEMNPEETKYEEDKLIQSPVIEPVE